MKKRLIAITLLIGLQSCYVTEKYKNANDFANNKLANIPYDSYEILDIVEYSEGFSRTNVLFVGVGSKKKKKHIDGK